MHKPALDSRRKQLALHATQVLVQRHLAAVHVAGTREGDPCGSTIYVSNHVSIWDAAVVASLSRFLFNKDPYIMTAERTMNAVLTWIGGFGIDTEDRFQAGMGLKFAVDLVATQDSCALWIFPQGGIFPFGEDIDLQPGIGAVVLKSPGAPVVPVAICHAFTHHMRPETFVRFGSPVAFASRDNVQLINAQVQDAMQSTIRTMSDDFCAHMTGEYKTVIYGVPDLRRVLYRISSTPTPPLNVWGRWYACGKQEDHQ